MTFMHEYHFKLADDGSVVATRDGLPFIVQHGCDCPSAVRMGKIAWGNQTKEAEVLAYWLLREVFKCELARQHASGFCYDVVSRMAREGFRILTHEIIAYVLGRLSP